MSEKAKAPAISAIRDAFFERKPGYIAQKKFYATLLPLIKVDGEWHVLFEVRSDSVEQPGEICFPGGAIEAGETPEECALREAVEEIGVEASDIELLGQNDTMVSGPNRVVFNFIGILDRDFEELTMNHAESQELFTIPLEYFFNTTPILKYADLVEQTHDDFPYAAVHYPEEAYWSVGTYEIVFYDYEKDPPLWGMTAGFMRRFVDIMKGQCPPDR